MALFRNIRELKTSDAVADAQLFCIY